MGQQPNVEIGQAERPRPKPEPGPATSWRSDKPGLAHSPEDVPRGAGFGHAGPDPGWALHLVKRAKLPSDDPNLRDVVTGLVMARAAVSGRAAVREDIDAALVILGYGEDPPPELVRRRERWLAAAPHDKRPGATAVSEVELSLLINKPEQIRFAQKLSEKS